MGDVTTWVMMTETLAGVPMAAAVFFSEGMCLETIEALRIAGKVPPDLPLECVHVEVHPITGQPT